MKSATEPVIRVHDLWMDYGAVSVLKGADFEVWPGEVVVMLGPNGAGKTTTIEILEGFRAPSAGDVKVLGQEPISAGEQWRARIGVVLQSWRDHAKWRVRELLAHFGEFYRPYGEPSRPRPWDVDRVLATVGLADKADRQIARLSGGERRRLDVALGLIGNPELLFLDEPTAGFDPLARREFHDLIRALSDDQVSILMTTHDLDEAERVADRILLLADGAIVANGTPDGLRLRVAGASEVRWSQDGATHVHAAGDPAAFLRELLNGPGGPITNLEVRRATLEDAYLGLVTRYEARSAMDSDVDLEAQLEPFRRSGAAEPPPAPGATTHLPKERA